MPTAASLAAAIEEKVGVKPKLIEGRGGVFDVSVHGETVFSKHEVGRFPTHDEILEHLPANR